MFLSEVGGNKKPSTTMRIEIDRFHALAAPASSLARPRSSILTAELGLNGHKKLVLQRFVPDNYEHCGG